MPLYESKSGQVWQGRRGTASTRTECTGVGQTLIGSAVSGSAVSGRANNTGKSTLFWEALYLVEMKSRVGQYACKPATVCTKRPSAVSGRAGLKNTPSPTKQKPGILKIKKKQEAHIQTGGAGRKSRRNAISPQHQYMLLTCLNMGTLVWNEVGQSGK